MVASCLILLADFQISNDGRHYLSSAESLRSGNGYFSFGRCGDLKNPTYLVDWPPIYSGVISIFAKVSNFSVFVVSKYYHFFTFLFFSVLLYFSMRNILTTVQLILLLLIMFNSEHYFVTNSEVMFLPIVFILYLSRAFWLHKTIFFGCITGLLYLVKYSFLFFLPFGLVYILINFMGSSNGQNSYKLIKGFLSYILGFFLIFIPWHLFVFHETGHFWPGFIGSIKLVESTQYFLDFSITWNLIPERFEKSTFILALSIILWLGVVLYAVKVLFKSVKCKYKRECVNDAGGLFFSLLFLAILSFYFLESYLHFNSTKRYLEDSQFLFVFMLFIEKNKYSEALKNKLNSRNKINDIFNNKIYRIILLILVITQSTFSVLKAKNIIELAVGNKTEMRDFSLLAKFLGDEFDLKSGRIFVTDKTLVSAILKFKYWDRIVEIDNTTTFNLEEISDNDVLVVQTRDNIAGSLKPSKNVFILER
jgi:hypothetical protein